MKKVDEVRYSTSARNFIKKAEPKLKEQIKEAIEKIKIIPSEGDIKPMQGYYLSCILLMLALGEIFTSRRY